MLNNNALSGEEDKAQQLMILREVLMNKPNDAAAWFQLASLIGDPERVKFCLEQVLKIDPKHAGARLRLEAMRGSQPDPHPETAPVDSWEESRCPFIGLVNDPQSLTAYPSPQNYCHRFTDPRSVKLEYQQQHCLGILHRRCLVFQRGEKAALQPAKEKPVLRSPKEKPAVKPLG